MNYGLYVSASGAAGAMYRLDVAANNLANVNTIGFKPDRFVAAQRDVARVEDELTLPSSALLERLGGGVLMAPNRVAFEQGPLQSTNEPLDIAIEGPGFLVLRDETDRNTDRVRLTRDGRLSRDGAGRLVSATEGMPVLDVTNRSIVLGGGPVSIDSAGAVRQDGLVVARIQLIDVPDPSRLARLGHGAFQAPSDALDNRQAARGVIRQGMLEAAAVDPVQAMMAVSTAASDAERNVSMIQQHDRLMDRAVNVLGRVA